MSFSLRMHGLLQHLATTLALNFKSRQALVYGYVVPVFFLFAFGSVFRSETPALLNQMGQLLTITVLGGACFGLPTALVAERERGVWRRYRLLPVHPGALLASSLVTRFIILVTAAALQIALARLAFGTPLPQHPSQALLAFTPATSAFLGIGLIVAALARDVPAVQALGQCLFLPMIMIGGVGVPLAVLPEWAQYVAAFMPGKYSVDVLQQSFNSPDGLADAQFSLWVLLVIAVASTAVGIAIFRWDAESRLHVRQKAAVGAALALWLAVGVAATVTGQVEMIKGPLRPEDITDELVATITYDDLTGDDELVTRLAPPFDTIEERYRMLPLAEEIKRWPPAQESDPGQRTRNLLSLAAMADINADLREADMARVIYDLLRSEYSHARLRQLLAWTILAPDAGEVVTTAPEFGFKRELKPEAVRQRSGWYAQKFLGRLVGKIAEPVETSKAP